MQVAENIFEKYPDVMKFHHFREALGIGRTLAYKLLQNKIVKSFKCGSEYRILKSSVIEYIKMK